MSTCTNCKRYTRGESPVCYECYTKGEKYVDGFHSFSFEKVPLKYIKGHVGEGIIQNLFSSLGFIVFKYGIENNLTYISEYLTNSDFSSAELNILRSRPDLLVLNKEKKRLYFIEVKYRNSDVFKYEQLGEDYKYNNAYLVIISKSGFKCIRASELKKIKKIKLNSSTKYDLSENEEFNLDRGFVKLIEEQTLNIYDTIEPISHLKNSKCNQVQVLF